MKNAEKVRIEIIEKIEALVSNPEKYPPDKYKAENDVIIALLNYTDFVWLISSDQK